MSPLPTFKLLRIPVTIHPSFLLIAVLLGWSSGFDSLEVMIGWVTIVVVSILLHELGHALVARSYGAAVEIELNGFGGLTRWGLEEGELPPGRRALVAAAGSATGLVFGGLVWLGSSFLGPFDGLAGDLIRYVIYVNVFWGLLNWVPIRPLDGGHLLSALLAKIAPSRADQIAKVIFTTTAALALLAAIRFRLIFVGILSAWLLASEFRTAGRRVPSAGLPALSYDDPGPEGSEKAEQGMDQAEPERGDG